MLRALIGRMLGDNREKLLRQYRRVVKDIRARQEGLADDSLEDLRAQLDQQRAAVADGASLESVRVPVLAIAATACSRLMGTSWSIRGKQVAWDMRPYDVQLIGALTLHDGVIAEMKTGEGKTLVAALALVLNALTGRGAHLITANSYLAQRDAEWMGGLYKALGLTCGVLLHGMPTAERQSAYSCDIVYGTTTEFGFDYLRDNMAVAAGKQVQKGLAYGIVDEVDSILIDEARTPLIISAPKNEATGQYQHFARAIPQLSAETDFRVDEKERAATLTEAGIERMEGILQKKDLFTAEGFETVHHIEQALKAHALFLRDKDYVVQDGQVVIVDEFTGRLMPGRRYGDGLHQALEAKEGLTIQQESRTLATITIQNFFRLYGRLAGMTGTAETEGAEFANIYNLRVLPIPTHKPVRRSDQGDAIFKHHAAKIAAIVKEVKARHAKGQPVLVGTTTIEKSEELARALKQAGIDHRVLNAKHYESEAKIVEQAGQRGAVTIATNMAGRGTDIRLGQGVADTGGLFILGTERHESRRIDNQLRGRSGRQGDPGGSRFFVGMDDALMRLFGGDKMRKLMHTLRLPEHIPIENSVISSSIERAQEKIESYHFDARKHLVQFDDVINNHRGIIYALRQRVLVAQQLDECICFLIHKIRSSSTQTQLARVLQLTQDASWDQIESAAKEHLSQQQVAHGLEVARFNVLRVIDVLWMQHLEDMKHLRENVALRGYGQRDPLNEYKQEAYTFFENLMSSIAQHALRPIGSSQSAGGISATSTQQSVSPTTDAQSPQPAKAVTQPTTHAPARHTHAAGTTERKIQDELASLLQADTTNHAPPSSPVPKQNEGVTVLSADEPPAGSQTHTSATVVSAHSVGRNQACPCGSGKKYKKCCGRQ